MAKTLKVKIGAQDARTNEVAILLYGLMNICMAHEHYDEVFELMHNVGIKYEIEELDNADDKIAGQTIKH